MYMKNIFLILLCLAFFSCEKEESTDLSVFMVRSEGIVENQDHSFSVPVGVPVSFDIFSDAQMIVCYTGDAGHNYEKRHNTLADGIPQLDFSYTPNRINATQEVSILVSQDFQGVYDVENVSKATWKNLTPQEMRDYLNTNSAKAMPSISLKEYVGEAPVFFAYRLKVNSTARFANPTISNFKLSNVSEDGSAVVVCDGINNAAFRMVTISDDEVWKATGSGSSMWKISSNSLTVNTPPFTVATDGKEHELWAISNCIYLSTAQPDTGITVRHIQENTNVFTYQYDKPGTYQVVFVAYNTGIGADTLSQTVSFTIHVG